VIEGYVRYCPDCGEEYQPHMTQCIDCGSALLERLEHEAPQLRASSGAEENTPENIPPGDYLTMADGLSAERAEAVVHLLVQAGIPVKVQAKGYGLCLSARMADRSAVVEILEREGAIPKQPEATAPVVGADGGPCPACGARIKPGAVECVDCGLRIGGVECENCGAELSPADTMCPACANPLE
jgi:hypothetical protein